MIFIGDYFALGLVITLCLFFFDTKISFRYMSSASKLFILCLITTALTAVIDLVTARLLELENIALWKNMLANTFYFIFGIITTSCIALYLFTKILVHTYERKCMRNAIIGLTAIFVIYSTIVLLNLKTGWLFYFENGIYRRGPLNALGYIATLAQAVLVCICYFRNHKNASQPMRRALLLALPLIPVCIIFHRINPDIMLNAFIMAVADTVLFLTFQGQRQGVHSLTKLNDRHSFFFELDHWITQKEPFQVFLINIKNFSAINQKYGHVLGDEYLYQFAFALDRLFSGCLSFHMNGTVFALIMRYTYQSTSEEQSGILLDFLENGIECNTHQIKPDYILTHYISTGKETSATELYETIEYAGTKAYGLKHTYTRCTEEITEEFARHRYLKERLATIDRAHGYEVWLQPIQCLADSSFCSMEALIRLYEPDGTMISPAEFIPLAEQTGYVNSVTWFVLEEVCRMLKTYPELANTSVSVNVPMAQLLEKGFTPRFTSIVDQAGIDHRRICIEFTERAMLDNFDQTKSIMEQLAANGFRFYLDDFGTGYSNFNCLLQLPFQIIKLDRCLVKYTNHGQPDYTMVHRLTNILHDMDLTVIAEGAETMEEVLILKEQGVDRVQGFALARPMPEDRLVAFYKDNPVE